MSSSTSTEADALAKLISDKREEQSILYLNIAFIMLLVYDHVITFAQEMQTIWQSVWRLPKILFMFNRYITPSMLILFTIVWRIPNLPEKFCDAFVLFDAWGPNFAVYATELMMAIRVSALYSHQKTIIVFLSLAYIGSIVVSTVMTAMYLYSPTRGAKMSHASTPGLPGCSWQPEPSFLSGAWIATVIYESCIIALISYKIFPDIGSHVVRGSPMLRLFACDSLIYFSFTFALVIATIVLYGTKNVSFKGLLTVPIGVTACITLSRMLMNMRVLYMQNGFNSGNTNTQLSNIVFHGIGDVGHSHKLPYFISAQSPFY